MKIKVGIMGSADETLVGVAADATREKAASLGRAAAARDLLVLTGATTGLPYAAGHAAHRAGALHVGISPAADEREHATTYQLPVDGCDVLVYTGFGLKGRNVVLVRSCDVVLIIGGSVGALNEFTIAYDEGKVIGCLTGTGGVADEAARLVHIFPKPTAARIFHDDDPTRLLDTCLEAWRRVGEF
ncbi:MAG: LOG family protein [Pyrinomonadaceae bacterium]|nr:LOG family protein [Pyrinomonadaceae bacterium]